MKRLVLGILALGVVGTGWALFRPERLVVDAKVNETLASGGGSAMAAPSLVSSGMFHGVAHHTVGQAAIHAYPDGRRVLRFTEFETSNGPDVQVYLVAAPDANDNESVTRAGFVPLGALKGNIGDQNYDVPPEVDLDRYQAVTVWCRRFGVNFATAPLRHVEGGAVS
jgi:hypothetical protein